MNNQNETPVEAMNLPEFIRRSIEAAQTNELYILKRIDAVTTPWLFPHQTYNGKGMLIKDEELLHEVFLRHQGEHPVDGVYAVVCNIYRQEINILVNWIEGEKYRATSVSYPLRKPVW